MSKSNLKINDALTINQINDNESVIDFNSEKLNISTVTPNPFKDGKVIHAPTSTLIEIEVQLDYVSQVIVAAYASDISTAFKDALLDWQFALIEKRRTFN